MTNELSDRDVAAYVCAGRDADTSLDRVITRRISADVSVIRDCSDTYDNTHDVLSRPSDIIWLKWRGSSVGSPVILTAIQDTAIADAATNALSQCDNVGCRSWGRAHCSVIVRN